MLDKLSKTLKETVNTVGNDVVNNLKGEMWNAVIEEMKK